MLISGSEAPTACGPKVASGLPACDTRSGPCGERTRRQWWQGDSMDRVRRAEVMDDPALESAPHRHALRGLSRLNRLSASDRVFWPSIAGLARRERRPLRVLDLASGSGDVALSLWRRARRAGIEVEIRGVDVSQEAVRYAEEQGTRAGAPVQFEVMDVLHDPLPTGFDVLVCSLFLHHVDEDQAILLLAKMRRAARRIVMVNDLLRSVRGLVLAYLAARLFTTSEVVHADAPRSVRSSFTVEEMNRLARRAEMDGAQVSRHWPLRLLLTWKAA
jgi:2-polyprenyl-3-methyl-5-hydroxy-6-metoxy-1,4-benzoquinol methylase